MLINARTCKLFDEFEYLSTSPVWQKYEARSLLHDGESFRLNFRTICKYAFIFFYTRFWQFMHCFSQHFWLHLAEGTFGKLKAVLKENNTEFLIHLSILYTVWSNLTKKNIQLQRVGCCDELWGHRIWIFSPLYVPVLQSFCAVHFPQFLFRALAHSPRPQQKPQAKSVINWNQNALKWEDPSY